MAQQYSTGVVAVYCCIDGSGLGSPNPATAGNAVLLGTAEDYPRMEVQTEHGTIINDITGPSVPMDRSFAGQAAHTSITLTWWNDLVFQKLEGMPGPGVGSPGNYSVGDMGAMLILERHSFCVWIRYLFRSGNTNKAQYASLPSGYRFPFSHMIGAWSPETGSQPMKRHLIFGHIASMGTVFSGPNPDIVLYDNNMSGVLNIPFSSLNFPM